MLERMCPHCGAANEATKPQCSTCGEQIAQPLARRAPAALRLQRVSLPARWQQPARIVALGVASIAAEAALHWLQQRQSAPRSSALSSPTAGRIIAAQQRIVERWDEGQLRERTVERTLWFDRDRQ